MTIFFWVVNQKQGGLMNVLLIAVGLFLLILSSILIFSYNALVSLRESLKKNWGNIDVILKQRFDEIPQLVKVCESYVNYEKNMVDKILSSRADYMNCDSIKGKIIKSNELVSGLNGLIGLGEDNLELKSNQNFLQIQVRLSELESKLTSRREFYNDSVYLYNSRIQQIPDVFIARLLGYEEEALFIVEKNEKVLNLKIG